MCVCVMYLCIVFPYMCVQVSTFMYTRREGIRRLALPLCFIPLGEKLSLNLELAIFAAKLAGQQAPLIFLCLPTIELEL